LRSRRSPTARRDVEIVDLGALRAVNSVAAEPCGLGNRKGRIAQGYDADLLAVRGDPLTDPTDLRNVAAVFRAGKPVRRPDA
jgi:imidazolonepropionase-like amidohydrolase